MRRQRGTRCSGRTLSGHLCDRRVSPGGSGWCGQCLGAVRDAAATQHTAAADAAQRDAAAVSSRVEFEQFDMPVHGAELPHPQSMLGAMATPADASSPITIPGGRRFGEWIYGLDIDGRATRCPWRVEDRTDRVERSVGFGLDGMPRWPDRQQDARNAALDLGQPWRPRDESQLMTSAQSVAYRKWFDETYRAWRDSHEAKAQ